MEVWFSNKTWGEFDVDVGFHKNDSEVDEDIFELVVEVAIVECGLEVDDDDDDDDDEVVEGAAELVDDVLEVVAACVEVVGVCEVEVEVVVAAAAVLEDLAMLELPDPPPASKTTMLAVSPDGTVTTQKLAPPAPAAESELVTPPIPSTEGSIEQGSPLQPEPEHTTLTPKVGWTVASPEAVQIGFHAIFTKVFPLESVFAPAT